MPTILISNDDGIDSPMLLPLARAMAKLGEVRVVVPDRERSWIGKAISRFDTLHHRVVVREDIEIRAVSGTPADCVNLGVHSLFPDSPDLVVSGVNLGLNCGLAFLLSSGTVGAALEAWIAGIPAIAFSTALPNDAYGLSGHARTRALGERPMTAAAVAAEITSTVLAHGFPADVDCMSVNMPADITEATPRVVGGVTRTRYGALFDRDGDGGYRHRFKNLIALDEAEDTDLHVVRRGGIAITPLRLDLAAGVPEALRAALEMSKE